jgi:hypothetical protein
VPVLRAGNDPLLFATGIMTAVTVMGFRLTVEHVVRVATLIAAMLAGLFSSFLFERLRPKGGEPPALGQDNESGLAQRTVFSSSYRPPACVQRNLRVGISKSSRPD